MSCCGERDLANACECYKNKDFEKAINLFSKAVNNLNEDNLKVKALCYKSLSLYELGIQYKKKQSFEDAKQKFEEAKQSFKELIEKKGNISLEPERGDFKGA